MGKGDKEVWLGYLSCYNAIAYNPHHCEVEVKERETLVTESQVKPVKINRWQRWRIVIYGFVGIVLFVFLAWGYLKYTEYRDWALFDELLAEQDRNHPHWRWQEFLPTPLQPGQINGALRFIEVGKQLTHEMLLGEDIPDENEVHYPMNTKEWLNSIESELQRRSDRIVRERCIKLELELPHLVEILPGCPPLNSKRPSAQAMWGAAGNEPPLCNEQLSYNLQARWLRLVTRYFINDGKSQQAVEAWRALLSSTITDYPGRISVLEKARDFYRDYRFLYQLLARTEPDETALQGLQQSVMQWRSHLYTMDDVSIDRALVVQLLLEMKGQSKGAFLTGLHQLYANPPHWLPKAWQEVASKFGIGSPSLATMYRMELKSHLRLFDYLEDQLRSGKVPRKIDLFNGSDIIPAREFDVYFLPRWKKIVADLADFDDNLHCMEALIAAERYRLKHGDYPWQWSDLVPSLLQEIPKAGDIAFKLNPVPEGLVIYVPSAKDHGGKVLRNYNPESDETDIEIDQGLMIFYPKYRREPPPTAKPPRPSDE